MVRQPLRSVLPLVLPLGFLAAGCGEAPALSTTSLPQGQYQVPYSFALELGDYAGPARFDLVGGGLPDGIALDAAGSLAGTPEEAGIYGFDVLISGLRGGGDVGATLELTVSAAEVAGSFVGFEPGQLNNMIDLQDSPGVVYMDNIWVRVAGTGEDGMQEYSLQDPGIYLPGDDGVAQAGFGDDERIGDLSLSAVDFEFSGWEPTIEERSYPNEGYPNPHLPEGLPPTFSASEARVTAGGDAGEAHLIFNSDLVAEPSSRIVQVVPPDWCPNGWSERSQEGYCE